MLLRARAHLMTGRHDLAELDCAEAASDLNAVHAADPVAAGLYVDAVSRSGDQERAMALAKRLAAKMRPAVLNVPYGHLAHSHARAMNQFGEREESIELLTETLRLPSDGDVDEVRHRLLYLRAEYLKASGRASEAVKDLTKIVTDSDDPTDAIAADACVARGMVLHHLGRFDEEVASYSFLTEASAWASDDVLADALLNRGYTFGCLGDGEREIADCTRVIQDLEKTSHSNLYRAHLNRAFQLQRLGGDSLYAAIDDYDAIMRLAPDLEDEDLFNAIVNRSAAYRLTNAAQTIDDCNTALAMDCAEAHEMRAAAHYNRALAYHDLSRKPPHGDHLEALVAYYGESSRDNLITAGKDHVPVTEADRQHFQAAMNDYLSIVKHLRNADPEHAVKSHVNLAHMYVSLEQYGRAWSHASCVIRNPKAPANQIASAAIARIDVALARNDMALASADIDLLRELETDDDVLLAGSLYTYATHAKQQQEWETAISFYDEVLVSDDFAPPYLAARARINRAVCRCECGDMEGAFVDCNYLIQWSDCPLSHQAMAYMYKGIVLWQKGSEKGLEYCRKARQLSKDAPITDFTLDSSLAKLLRDSEASQETAVSLRSTLQLGGQLLNSDRWQASIKYINKAIEGLDSSGDDANLLPKSWELRMYWCLMAGDRVGAVAARKRLMALDYPAASVAARGENAPTNSGERFA
ncbi:MAG: hypothetical protein AAFV43_11025 [Planctomycetota bacterium]